jgi:hypothetical protein
MEGKDIVRTGSTEADSRILVEIEGFIEVKNDTEARIWSQET